MRRILSLFIAFVLFVPIAYSRTTENIDFGWRFHLGDVPSASQAEFNDSGWRLLDLPHDWSIQGDYKEDNPGGGASAYLPTGIGWYRKSFTVSKAMLARSVWVAFDGVFMDSTVWINGYKLGTRPYGYISFFYILTGHLHLGTNVIAVRVNNSLQPAARWYTGSGIYGHVTLSMANRVHIAQWSTFVHTLQISPQGVVAVDSTKVDGCSTTDLPLTVQYSVEDRAGHLIRGYSAVIRSLSDCVNVPAGKIYIHDPQLWSPDTPSLYTLHTRVLSGSRLVDEVSTRFGIRTATFDANRGFLLNGVPVKLRGVADHLYGGPMGTAIPDSILVRRLQLLKEMGTNAIRTSHNPHPPEFYDLCDQMGIMVLDEIFDGWHRKAPEDYGARFFAQWWRRDVHDWVVRDRNHPSVILWSIGNETGYSDKWGISEWVHKFDPTRDTTGGRVYFGVDVAGFNGASEIPGVLEKFHKEHPKIPIVLTESPHTYQTRGFYRVRTWWRDWKHYSEFQGYGKNQIFFDGKQWFRSSYDNAMVRITARQSWKQVSSTPWISGAFRWTGFDYLGEADYKGGRWPDRAKSGVGVLDLAAIPKDDYYLYQSFWTSKPMVHLLPNWTHTGMDGIVIPVVAYSNQPEVELSLNGHSLGRKGPGPLGDFLWDVPYHAGTLKAVAYAKDGAAVASETLETAGTPVRLELTTDNAHLRADRRDTAVVTVETLDSDGHMVPWDANRVDFRVDGPVHLLGYENGDPTDVTPNQASWRRLFYGMARGFYEATSGTSPVEVTAAAILGDQLMGFEGSKPKEVAISVAQVALRGKLPPYKLEIHYTLDGSTPTKASALYSGPFTITDTTVVRALILRDGSPYMTASARFQKIDHELISDPRWATDSQADPLSHSQ